MVETISPSLMNFADRMTASRPRPDELCQRMGGNEGGASHLVGTRGGCGEGRGPCACPRASAMLSAFREPSHPGQAQGPHILSSHPLVPTERDAPASSFPPFVGTIHQNGDHIFRYQNYQ